MSIIGRLIEEVLWIWTRTFGQGIWYGIALTIVTTFKTLAQKVVKKKEREEKEMKKRTDP